MSAKISARRKQAFLDALRATGNQSLAAEAAKVSRSWVQLQRSSDPEFRRAVAEAVAAAKARLSGTPGRARDDGGGGTPGRGRGDERGRRSNRPPAGWEYFGGFEMVVRGTNGRRTQIARARLKQWTPRAEARFLAALAKCCNARAAAAAAGLSYSSAYAHRYRWPEFAAAWDEAVDIGYDRVDSALTAEAIRLFEPRDIEPEIKLTGMTVDDAIRIVRVHDSRRRETGIVRREALGHAPIGRPRRPRQWR